MNVKNIDPRDLNIYNLKGDKIDSEKFKPAVQSTSDFEEHQKTRTKSFNLLVSHLDNQSRSTVVSIKPELTSAYGTSFLWTFLGSKYSTMGWIPSSDLAFTGMTEEMRAALAREEQILGDQESADYTGTIDAEGA